MKALADDTAMGQKPVGLRCALHPFGDDIHAETAAQLDDGVDNGRVTRILFNVRDKAAIDLQYIDRILFEVAERGKAGAEIVQRDAHPRL